ncbi:MAG: DHHW family protein [Roseburia sp.]|nr:DHHW family protein [Roseburia sp.]
MSVKKSIAIIMIMSGLFFGMSLWCMGKSEEEISVGERRHLAAFPDLTWDTVLGGTFMAQFEEYASDQFPLRECFRRVNSYFQFQILQKKEVDDIYLVGGHAAKLSYRIDKDAMTHWLKRFSYINDKYLEDCRVYLSIIPDKSFFLAGEGVYPSPDDYEFVKQWQQGTKDFATYIGLEEVLFLENFYRTDIHWKQETLRDTAECIASGMGVSLSYDYEIQELEQPFYGVYYGQAALPLKPDRIRYLTGKEIDSLVVTCYDTGEPQNLPVYDMERAFGRDAYEMFLSGSKALLTIENPTSQDHRELVLFRDSFGSSIAPLLAKGYSKITLVDIRYIIPEMLGKFVDFDGADVLFLYHMQVLNTPKA